MFFVNVPIGLVAVALALRLLPPPEPRAGTVRSQIDGVGAGLLGLAVLAVLLLIIDAMASPATPLWFLMLLAPLLGLVFVRWERRVIRRHGAPLLDVGLFTKAPGYASGIVLGSTYFCGFAGVWLVLALDLQDGLGYSPLQSGLTVMPFAIGSAVGVDHRRAGSSPAGAGGDRDRAVPGRDRVRPDDRRHPLTDRGHEAAWLFVPLADRRGRRRRDDLAEHHPDARVGADPMGGCGRRRAADRPADRQRDRCGGAHRRLPADRAGRTGTRCRRLGGVVVALVFTLAGVVRGGRELRIRPDLGEADERWEAEQMHG